MVWIFNQIVDNFSPFFSIFLRDVQLILNIAPNTMEGIGLNFMRQFLIDLKFFLLEFFLIKNVHAALHVRINGHNPRLINFRGQMQRNTAKKLKIARSFILIIQKRNDNPECNFIRLQGKFQCFSCCLFHPIGQLGEHFRLDLSIFMNNFDLSGAMVLLQQRRYDRISLNPVPNFSILDSMVINPRITMLMIIHDRGLMLGNLHLQLQFI